MEKYLKLLVLILNLVACKFIYPLTGTPAPNGPIVSSQFAVRNVLSDDNIPVVNITPSRPTLVQFPSEISNCTGASKNIKLSYADATATTGMMSQSSNSSNNQTQPQKEIGGSAFSAVFLTVDLSGNTGQKDENGNNSSNSSASFDDLKATPTSWYLCRMKREKIDTFCVAYNENSEPYCWVSFAVRIVDPEFTNGIVILDKPNGQNNLISPEQLEGVPFVNTFLNRNTRKIHEGNSNFPVNKSLPVNKIKKPIPTKKSEAILVQNSMLNTNRPSDVNNKDTKIEVKNKLENKSQEDIILNIPLPLNDKNQEKNKKMKNNQIIEKKLADRSLTNKNSTVEEEKLVNPLFLKEIIEK